MLISVKNVRFGDCFNVNINFRRTLCFSTVNSKYNKNNNLKIRTY